jgi:chromosome segregation ATPase
VDQLEGELSDATPDAAAIEVLEEQLTNLREESERTKGQFEDMVASKIELDQESRTKKQVLETAQKARQDLDFRLNKAHSTVRKLQNTREEELKRKNAAITKVDQAQVVRTEWVTRQEECQKELDVAIEGAREVCPERVPVPEGKSSQDLADTWAKLVETRKRTEKELGGSQDELLRQANEAKRMHKDAMQEFQDITNLRNVSWC